MHTSNKITESHSGSVKNGSSKSRTFVLPMVLSIVMFGIIALKALPMVPSGILYNHKVKAYGDLDQLPLILQYAIAYAPVVLIVIAAVTLVVRTSRTRELPKR